MFVLCAGSFEILMLSCGYIFLQHCHYKRILLQSSLCLVIPESSITWYCTQQSKDFTTLIQYKDVAYQSRKSHCGDTTVVRLSYFHNGNSFIGKTSSFYWNSLQTELNNTLHQWDRKYLLWIIYQNCWVVSSFNVYIWCVQYQNIC